MPKLRLMLATSRHFIGGLKVYLGLGLALGLMSSTTPALASHGSYNPMMPRQLSQTAAQADYSYGYGLLSGHAIDSLEPPNRAMWYLNYDLLDHYVLRPVAHGYASLPRGVQDSVGNFFANLDEVNNIPNNLLIGEVGDSGLSLSRLVINSTIGIAGLFDVAAAMGLEGAPMAMDTVLGKGGMEQGPFLMVPAYGPSTARSLQGDTIDGLPWMTLSWPITLGKFALEGVHNRAQLIDQESVVDNALDPYVQTRDVFLMYSHNKVNPVVEGEVKEDESAIDPDFLDEIDG